METIKADTKLPKMVMCGDHPSLTKTELNLKEMKVVESKDKDRKIATSYARISPTSSRTEKPRDSDRVRSRPASEHALRTPATRARARDTCRPDAGDKELLQAALVSFRWPPYLVVSWLLVLAAAHVLHALAAALAAGLPSLRALCQYMRLQTEESWRDERAARVRPALLASAAAVLYALLGALVAAHALLRWAVEPLGADGDDGPSRCRLARVTDYIDQFDVDTEIEKQ